MLLLFSLKHVGNTSGFLIESLTLYMKDNIFCKTEDAAKGENILFEQKHFYKIVQECLT